MSHRYFLRRRTADNLDVLINKQEDEMQKFTTLVAVTALAVTFAVPGLAATSDSGNGIVVADHSMRTSKLIGATVYNDQGQGIGSVVDVLVRNTAAEPTAILSVGDFIGSGTKLIAVPLSHVNLDGAKPIMAGATKPMLASMPVYLFAPIMGNNGG
jgi:sporulation protein YlmC with PRC-barrel domain